LLEVSVVFLNLLSHTILPGYPPILWIGLPSPDYFPFSSIAGEALVPESFPLTVPHPPSPFAWLWNLFSASSSANDKTSKLTIFKYAAKPGDLCLATTLQYSPAVAIPQLQQIIYDFTARVYQPAYEDFTTLIHTGNTDGFVLPILSEIDANLMYYF
jgi:aromatic amino acid aminotransferase I / 2-aminoadipate transaminase